MSRKEDTEKRARRDGKAAEPSFGSGIGSGTGTGTGVETGIGTENGSGIGTGTGTGTGVPAGAPKKSVPEKKGAGSVRLDKLLGQEGFGTRSELGKAIRKGKVSVNGAVVKDPGLRVSPEDEILFDGKAVRQQSLVYYMLHKPAGVISATEDSRERTVLDLLRDPAGTVPATGMPQAMEVPQGSAETGSAGEPCRNPADAVPATGMPQEYAVQPVLRRGLFPVGRLDKDTEGLLLITDDGQTAHRLLAPGKHVDKTYYAVVAGRVTGEDIRAFADGLEVDGEFTAMPAPLRTEIEAESAFSALLPKDVSRFLPDENTLYTQVLVTIREGKFHQIRRMFAARGMEVLYLKRLSMGPLVLDASLAPGQFRPLTQEEIQKLLSADLVDGRQGGKYSRLACESCAMKNKN